MTAHATLTVSVKNEFGRMVELVLGILKNGAHTRTEKAILDNCFMFFEYLRYNAIPQGPWPPLLRERTSHERAEVEETNRQYKNVMEILGRGCDEVYKGFPRIIAVAFVENGLRLISKNKPVPEQVVQFFEKVHEYLSEDWVHVEEAETALDV